MGSIHHANAKTTVRIREEIQNSKESIAALAKRLSLNQKTVAKWRHAGRVTDAKSGARVPKSRVLSATEEQAICAFRRTTRHSLDDCYIALRDHIPALSRSNLYRTLKRHGLAVLPDLDNDRPSKSKKKFAPVEVGFVHIDITTIRLESRNLYLFVGIDRVCKYAYAELHNEMTIDKSVNFLTNLINDCPFKIHTILTDNGAQFTYALLAEHLRPKNKIHAFDMLCKAQNITHKLTKFRHPWTNGQVEIMNQKIKNNTTKKYHYNTIEQFKKHLMAYLLAYNHQKPLKALKYKTPYDTLIQLHLEKPELFHIKPIHKLMGLNNYLSMVQ